jgi:hypothetical protein
MALSRSLMTCRRAPRGAVGDAVDEVAELAQALELARGHVLGHAFLEDGGEQADVAVAA